LSELNTQDAFQEGPGEPLAPEVLPIKFPVEVALKYPIEVGSFRLDKIIFSRRLKAKDLYGIKASNLMDYDFKDMVLIAARLSEQDANILGNLDVVDVGEVVKVIGNFLSDSQ
jgi:hypothetical protein